MNFPIRGFLTSFRVQAQIQGNLTDFRVQVPSDTLNPHDFWFPGMRDRHPGAGCRLCRATGGLLVLLPPSGAGPEPG
jgi:hypothetical protein